MSLVCENYLKGELQDIMETDIRTMFKLSFSDLREGIYDKVVIADESRLPCYTMWRDTKSDTGVVMVRHYDGKIIVLHR